ncbi:MAG: extracellular solute-binding protein [Spirochaetota bacterium]
MKKILVLCLMCFLILSPEIFSEGAKEKKAAGSGELTIMAASGLDVWGPVWDNFNKTYPNIKINHIQTLGTGEAWEQKVATAVIGGENLDIVQSNVFTYYNLASKGYFEDLEPYFKKDGIDYTTYFGSLTDSMKIPRGKVDGFPWYNSPWLMFYNKKLMDGAGLSYPVVGWTWDQFENYSAKLTRGEGANKVYAYYGHTWDICLALFGTEAARGDYYKNSKVNIKDPRFQKGITFYKNLIDKGYAVPIKDMKSLKMHYSGTFLTEKAAMIYMGAWTFQYIKDKQKFPHAWLPGITSLPIPDSSYPQNYTTGAPSTASIVARSKNKELAWEFVKFFVTDPYNQILVAKQLGGLAVYIPKGREQELFGGMLQDSDIPISEAQALTGPPALTFFAEKPIGPAAPAYGRIIEEELPLYYNGEKDLAATLDTIEKRVNEAIQTAK